MGRAQPSAMTGASPPPTQPAAVAAFLRGLERRARLLAQVQAGDPASAARALDVTARVFTADAAQWPLAQWPRQYWRLLLSVPAMRQPGTAPVALLPGIARLAPAPRAAILLHLVAGLDDADAAAALGIAVDAYQARIRDALPRDALGQPDVDVWRAWRAASQRALDALPEAMPVAGTAAPANAKPDAPRLRTIDGQDRHRRRLRWLWLGVALCAAALVATFLLHPRGRALLGEWRNPVHVTPLPPADAPQARFDPGDPALHPDLALLQAPADLRLARELPLLAWLATENATAAQATDTDTSAAAATSTTPATPVVAPTPDASTLAQRLKAWDRLPPQARAAQRGAWAEWQALTDAERTTLRATAARFDALPLDQQRGLRDRYAQLPFDARRGWHLGPRLGRDWPRIVPLFAFVAPDERTALLELLRQATPEDFEALARLAQTTPPEDRAALRRDLLAQAPAQRTAWLQGRLQR